MDARLIISVIDSLDSTSTTDALSANQGSVLKGMIDSLNSKDIMTVRLEENFIEETGGVYTEIPMTLYNSIGTKLTCSNNAIVIGEGVSKVLVSSNLKIIANVIGNKHSRICKNGTTMCWTDNRAVSVDDEITINNTPILIDVTSGDLITLRYYVSAGDQLCGGAYTPTYLTVEVVE